MSNIITSDSSSLLSTMFWQQTSCTWLQRSLYTFCYTPDHIAVKWMAVMFPCRTPYGLWCPRQHVCCIQGRTHGDKLTNHLNYFHCQWSHAIISHREWDQSWAGLLSHTEPASVSLTTITVNLDSTLLLIRLPSQNLFKHLSPNWKQHDRLCCSDNQNQVALTVTWRQKLQFCLLQSNVLVISHFLKYLVNEKKSLPSLIRGRL